MLISDFDYDLPQASIAQQAPPRRDRCRLAVIERGPSRITHTRFDQIGSYLAPGDLLVVNDSKVLPARIPARRATGGAVEIFLLDPGAAGPLHRAFLKPGRVKDGEALLPEREPSAGAFRLLSRDVEGVFSLAWEGRAAFGPRLLSKLGVTPLPPYINRERVPEALQAKLDQRAYQTVYARETGSVAAPTAGLHFSPGLLRSLQAAGVGVASVTLHVGAGTFLPVKTEALEDHPIHEEHYFVPPDTVLRMAQTRSQGHRVVAVGTTALRALESAARHPEGQGDGWARTRLFLKPGDPFLAVDGLLTNFHQPRSTLLPLICAFWNRDAVLALYQECLGLKYQFLSYGDACLFL
jgi:S-adenosylmethionine:tRNA ribosyltransferase-isomerase